MTDLNKVGPSCTWKDLTDGMMIYEGGTSRQFKTGEWASIKPEYIESKCIHCLLCTPVCPDSAIPVKDMKRCAFDYDHCKGCGICVKACRFGAIVMEGVNK